MGLAKNLLPVANRLLALNLVFPKPTCSSSSFGVGIACLRKPAAPQKFLNPLAALSPPPRVNGIIGGGIVRLFGVKVLGVKMGFSFLGGVTRLYGNNTGYVSVYGVSEEWEWDMVVQV